MTQEDEVRMAVLLVRAIGQLDDYNKLADAPEARKLAKDILDFLEKI